MTGDKMFSGESKNIEYKIALPEKSEKYMKTIVAFANSQGGKLRILSDSVKRPGWRQDRSEKNSLSTGEYSSRVRDSCWQAMHMYCLRRIIFRFPKRNVLYLKVKIALSF